MVTKNDKVVLVTGANKGLGKEIGRQLGALGYTVVLAARDEQAGDAAAAELVAAGCDAQTCRLEVTDPDHIASLVSYLETTFGKLDVLVNNAGISLEWDGEPTNADKIRRTLEVNLIAPYAITEALVPLLSCSDDARVINQSSMLGSIGTAESAWEHVERFMTVGYSTSKAALNMLTADAIEHAGEQGDSGGRSPPRVGEDRSREPRLHRWRSKRGRARPSSS